MSCRRSSSGVEGACILRRKRQIARMYAVKEIYYTLQGEGAQAGRPAVFCRFAGCNLWSGREQDREAAACNFCDTDFVGTDGPGGGKFADAGALARACRAAWRGNSGTPSFVVLTGGEPMLQVDEALIQALHGAGFAIALETNGTLPVPRAHRLDLRQPEGRRSPPPALGRRTQARLPARCARPGSNGKPRLRAFPAPADGRGRALAGQSPRGD